MVASAPAAFLTMMFDSAGKEPNGTWLYLTVLLGPPLIGLLAFVLGRRIDPNALGPAASAAVVASFVASVVLFVAALLFLIN